mmetsp:Transcript_17019/g.25759  ORF Transcript_17019/g.25759 Transcript_17019/m.25759 type:complete len:131 (-) Transcript_17019:1200-1592(-)
MKLKNLCPLLKIILLTDLYLKFRISRVKTKTWSLMTKAPFQRQDQYPFGTLSSADEDEEDSNDSPDSVGNKHINFGDDQIFKIHPEGKGQSTKQCRKEAQERRSESRNSTLLWTIWLKIRLKTPNKNRCF